MTVFGVDLSLPSPVHVPSQGQATGVGTRVGDYPFLPEPKVPVSGSEIYKPQAPAADAVAAQRAMTQLRQLFAGFGPLILACIPHDDTSPASGPVPQAPEPRGGYDKPEVLPPRAAPVPAQVGRQPEGGLSPIHNGGASGGYHRIMHDFVNPGMWGQVSTGQQLKLIGVGLVVGAAMATYRVATAAFSFFVVPPETQENNII